MVLSSTSTTIINIIVITITIQYDRQFPLVINERFSGCKGFSSLCSSSQTTLCIIKNYTSQSKKSA